MRNRAMHPPINAIQQKCAPFNIQSETWSHHRVAVYRHDFWSHKKNLYAVNARRSVLGTSANAPNANQPSEAARLRFPDLGDDGRAAPREPRSRFADDIPAENSNNFRYADHFISLLGRYLQAEFLF